MSQWRFERPPGFPAPRPAEEARPFFDALREGRLAIQRCAGCGALAHPPLAACPKCARMRFDWPTMSGKGRVYSYVVTDQAVHPAFAGHAPLATVEVELAEGPRLISNLVDVPPAEVCIGLPVRVGFQAVGDGVVLPLFRAGEGD